MSGPPGLEAIIRQLREDLAFRRIASGMQTLESARPALAALGPPVAHAGVFLGMLAQWVDAGFGGAELVRDLLARFPAPSRAALPLADYLHVRMAEGMVALAEEDFEQANQHFRFVQSLEGEVDDAELLAIANFWTARCLRRIGRYDDALSFTAKATNLANDCGYGPMAAVMQVLESWLAFQKGKLKEACALLERAEATLGATDDFVGRGNIQSAYGRIARRQGRYEQALEYFDRAITEYKRWDPQHLHLARSLVNIASVERLIALRCQKQIDRASARRRGADALERSSENSRARRMEVERLRSAARAHLAEAMQIYGQRRVHRGIGSVHINSGLLHLDSGDLECAASEALRAFSQGEEKRDYIVMARARMLQCTIENARLEEQIGEDPARHAQLAYDCARDAVEYARQTQNRRLLARACVWQGLTHAGEHFQNREAARRCLDEARALLRSDAHEQEYEWEDLGALEARLLRTGEIDPILREWSDGNTGGKTFQQITEEFAAVMIPKVWEREDRKISRVADRLSISPKKVRRILQAAGLLGRGATED
ncbi:MAG: tetratricopeptide repeat protein [Acidobacteriia bacterium]|nr:tetratricopeptide repeat protein [Terriglobia bacterium]